MGFIVVTTDRGLCGGLNINLLKASLAGMSRMAIIKECRYRFVLLLAVKEKLFLNASVAMWLRMPIIWVMHLQLQDLIGVVKVMLDAYKQGELDALYLLFYNEFVNTMTQKPSIQTLLPITVITD